MMRTIAFFMVLGAALPACSQKESPTEMEQPTAPAEVEPPEPATKTTEVPLEAAAEVPTVADFEAKAAETITDENLETELETLEQELETE